MFSLIDSAGIVFAAVAFVLILVLPGYTIARATNLLGFSRTTPEYRIGLALLAAYATIPVGTALITQFAGLRASLAVVLVLAALGANALRTDSWPRPTRRTLTIAAIWISIVIFAWIDIEWNNQLFLSLISYDMVKHAAITRAIYETGTVPPIDPFFLRDGTAVFYYFYFVPSALVRLLTAGLVDQRAAVAGQIIWTGAAVFSVAKLTYQRAGFRDPQAASPLLLALLALSGLQIIFVAAVQISKGIWMGQINWANDMVAGWLTSLVWVPHHVAGLVAAWTALLYLTELVEDNAGQSKSKYGAVALMSGAGFASTAGLSLWVALGAAAIAAVWTLLQVRKRSAMLIWPVAATALIALILAAPFLFSLINGREASGSPIALSVRQFVFAKSLADILDLNNTWTTALNFISLPINYLIEFGLIGIATVLYWRQPTLKIAHANATGQLVTVAAIMSLLIGSLLKSIIGNNDLGFRIMLFAQMSALLWATHTLFPIWQKATAADTFNWRAAPRDLAIIAMLGLAGSIYDLASIRLHHPFGQVFPTDQRLSPAVDLDLRRAYVWLNARATELPAARRKDVIQQNPDAPRTFAHSLYSNLRTGVSDREAFLLGAVRADVDARITALSPIYNGQLTLDEVATRARQHNVTVLVVTSDDGAWALRAPWLTTNPALEIFTTPHVRVFNLAKP